MSGTKSSDVSYDRRGDLILNIRSSREDLLRRMKFLTNEVQELCNKIKQDCSFLKNKHLKSALYGYIESLNDRIAELSEKEEALNSFTVITKASLMELEKDQRKLRDEYNFNAEVTSDLNSVRQKISEVIETDDILSKLGTQFNELERIKKGKGVLLQEYAQQEYQGLVKNGNSLKQQLDKYLGDIASGKIGSVSLSSVKDTYKNLISHTDKINGMITDCTVKDSNVKALKKEIERLRKDINEQGVSAKDMMIKKMLDNYTTCLKDYDSTLDRKEYDGMNKKLETISVNLPMLRKADETCFNIETLTNGLEAIFKEHDVLFNKWVMNDYDDCIKGKTVILEKSAEYKNEFQKGNISAIKELDTLLEETRSLTGKVDSALSLATEKSNTHQKRLYVIKSLREVCASLGFQEMDEPHYVEKDNSYSPVTQNFNTINRGTITFNVSLDGKLESSSCITVDHCDEEFSKFSELLKDQFGIETAFKREEDGEPIKKYKTAKDLPTSAGKLTQSK